VASLATLRKITPIYPTFLLSSPARHDINPDDKDALHESVIDTGLETIRVIEGMKGFHGRGMKLWVWIVI